MRRTIFILFTFLLLSPLSTFAGESNAGFVQGLWYSSDEIFEGVPTRIYIAVRNNTEHDLTGTVRFADNGKRIGSSEISALSGRLVEAWVDWTPSYGEHTITATVSDATLHILGGGTESIDISSTTETNTLTVDYDTDKDGIGNAIDTDDDNDGVSDSDEKDRGTNSLVANPKVQEKESVVDTDTPEVKNISSSEDTSSSDAQGLEQYVSEGVTATLLGNASEKIETAKQSLDTYRKEREEALALKKEAVVTPQSEVTTLGTYTDTATITRTKIEPEKSLLNSFVTSISSLLSLVWTGILWTASTGLSQPALLELALLLGIIYMIYRIARNLGRRNRY